MTDAGIFICTVCWIAWMEWRDYRRGLAWREDQDRMTAARKAETDALLARQAVLMGSVVDHIDKHAEKKDDHSSGV